MVSGVTSLLWSAVAVAQGASPPGIVVAHSPASSRQYIGSPSLALWTNGHYVAAHDLFGPGSTHDTTRIYSSSDRGNTWRQTSELKGQFWSSLFVHRGALYLLGPDRQDGRVVIRQSFDGGTTWSTPRDSRNGLLMADGKYHCAPMPVIAHQGRLWRAMEKVEGTGGWGKNFRSFMMSIPEGSDLLVATNWTVSSQLGWDASYLGGKFGGWLEGNAVVTPAGGIANVLRVDFRAGPEKAAMIHISPDGKTAAFDPASGFVDFPGGCKKFTIRHDAQSGRYWSLSNFVPETQRGGNPERTRNTLALVSSADLKAWSVHSIQLHHPDAEHHAFQYVDWLVDGEDLIALSRTAFDDAHGGAARQHDANFLTFHRFPQFRAQAHKVIAP